MRAPRITIAGLMGVVLVASLGLAALRSGSEIWAGVMLLLTCGMLALAVVGVACRGDARRVWWLGFALFGFGYLTLAFWPFERMQKLPTMTLLEAIRPTIGSHEQFLGGKFRRSVIDLSYAQAGHCLWALLAAALGGIVASAVFAGPTVRSEKRAADPEPGGQAERARWRQPAVIGLAGLVLITSVSLVGSRLDLALSAGVTFLLTCDLLGLAVLGAAVGRGKGRAIWMGAALFGAGYMLLAFGRDRDRQESPYLVTEQFLNALLTRLPPIARGFPQSSDLASANARIVKALGQQVKMSFPDDTPLEDVLMYIQAATKGPDGRGIPIYVDPVGLQEAEKSMQSAIQIDRDAVPLGTSLRLCLKQLGLTYTIRDGLLLISNPSQLWPVNEDPFLIVGHCIFALLAACAGGVVAAFLYDPRREPSGSPGARG